MIKDLPQLSRRHQPSAEESYAKWLEPISSILLRCKKDLKHATIYLLSQAFLLISPSTSEVRPLYSEALNSPPCHFGSLFNGARASSLSPSWYVCHRSFWLSSLAAPELQGSSPLDQVPLGGASHSQNPPPNRPSTRFDRADSVPQGSASAPTRGAYRYDGL